MPTWPTSISHYIEVGSLQVSDSNEPLRTEFENGPSRVRRRFTSRIKNLSFTLSLTDLEATIFESFWELELDHGTKWFDMPIYLGRGEYEIQTVRLLGKYTISDNGFQRVKIELKVESRGNILINREGLWFLEFFGPEPTLSFTDQLDKLVNINYPELSRS